MRTWQSIEQNLDFDKQVLRQLNKILSFPPFLNSDILSKFLKFLVYETLAGKQDQIKEYTIALLVLNKPAGFLPKYNAIVRVHASRLRGALHRYYDQKGSVNDCIIRIPKGQYVPEFEKLDNTFLSKKTNAISQYGLHESKKNSIACVPFRSYNLTMRGSSFADSLGETLTMQLSNHTDLSVLSYHTTCMLTAGKAVCKNPISSYPVQYIITGSCRIEDAQTRVFVELIDAVTATQLWSEIYCPAIAPENFIKAVDEVVSDIIADLSKFKSLCFENTKKELEIPEKINDGPVVYLSCYKKNAKLPRPAVGN